MAMFGSSGFGGGTAAPAFGSVAPAAANSNKVLCVSHCLRSMAISLFLEKEFCNPPYFISHLAILHQGFGLGHNRSNRVDGLRKSIRWTLYHVH